ncbi:small ribosomal subunit protein mS35-like [Lineus longissimus]|uniref:small ribosomal subunit protein mS35-like n=1 Tax=Lineus longissimus TaxID=88925 RepID=UPI00315D5616
MFQTCSKCRSKFLQFVFRGNGNFSVINKFQYPRIINAANFSNVPQEELISEPDKNDVSADDEFRVYEIPGLKRQERRDLKKRKFREPPPPRYQKMPIDQDWTKVWPTAGSFKWSVVPFPVRQGYIKNMSENEGIVPGKYANAELIKIPNFLHLTPAHIEKHCNAIKKFCTPWPEGLETPELCDKHFPLTIIQSDYCYSGPSVRHPKSRITKLRFKLSSLELDYHAHDKMIRLLGDRYNKKNEMVTIEVDRCPLKKQNYDFCMYLLTALYHESWKTEPWELGKEEADWEKYFWDLSPSKTTAVDLVKRMKELSQGEENTPEYLENVTDESDDEIAKVPEVQQLKQAVTELHNHGENQVTVNGYKGSVLKVLGLEPL